MDKAASFLAGVLLALTALAPSMAGEKVSVKTMPPVVIKTVPCAGETEVDPGLSEIKVTFSKKMMDKSWSWVMMDENTFPKLQGQPRFLDDQRTCVVKVKLEPGKTYVIWFNSERYQNFRDTEGRPAIPYLLVFETRK